MDETAQKTGKEGATNSKDPNGKLSLKERKFKAWIIGELGGRKDRGNGRVVRTVTAVDMHLYFPTIFLLFPLILLEKLGSELEGDPNVEK